MVFISKSSKSSGKANPLSFVVESSDKVEIDEDEVVVDEEEVDEEEGDEDRVELVSEEASLERQSFCST